jgi:hypothetical protein
VEFRLPKEKPWCDCPQDVLTRAGLYFLLYGSAGIICFEGEFRAVPPQEYVLWETENLRILKANFEMSSTGVADPERSPGSGK